MTSAARRARLGELEERLMSGQARQQQRLGNGGPGAVEERCHLRERAVAILRVAGERRDEKGADPRERRDVAHARRGRISASQQARHLQRRSQLSGRQRASERRRRRNGLDLEELADGRHDLGARAADLERSDRAGHGGAQGSGERGGGDLGGAGDAATGEQVGPPGQRRSVANLDDEIRCQHRHPPPDIARLTELWRVVEPLVGRKRRRGGCCRGQGCACRAITPLRKRTRHGRQLPAAAVGGRPGGGEAPAHEVEHRVCAVQGSIEAANEHHARLRGQRRQRRLDRRDPAALRGQPDRAGVLALEATEQPRQLGGDATGKRLRGEIRGGQPCHRDRQNDPFENRGHASQHWSGIG
jgi:hypothetical protein